PSVIGFAAIIAVFLPMILDVTYAESVYRALSFLVISCPCALVVSVPLSFFAGIGTAAKHGVLVKGSSVLEDLAGISQIAYDKTGTITDGSFEISVQGSEKTLEYAAYAEAFSSHPIAKSIKSAYGKKIDENRVCNCKEVAGFGITAVLDEKPLLCGRIELLESAGIKKSGDINKICTKSSSSAEIYVGYDKNFVGTIKLKEKIKPETECAFKKNRKLGIKKQIILSGDCFSAVNEISKNVGADGFFARLMPDEKAKKVIELKKCGKVAFVGDGINDAPVLTAADVGIAMGGLGSEAAIDASDAVIMGDSLKKIPFAIELSRKVCKIAKINIIFVIFIKFLILLLSAAGIVGMWAAVFADVGALIIAVLNSMTIFFKSEK
ncbi:MAG: HAD-IC family P-type ATPase, partial [Clostridia bacterium]